MDEGLADGTIACPDPDASVSRLLALLDGLSVAAEVFGSVSRAQLRRWLDGAIAAELTTSHRWLRKAKSVTKPWHSRGFVTALRAFLNQRGRDY